MIYEKIPLMGCGDATLIAYAPDNNYEIDEKRKRSAVILCAGGAYQYCSFREEEPVALQLLAADVCVFVLQYAVAPNRYPTSLVQLAAAVRYVREHAEQYHVNRNKVVVMGFSAGGHLAASLGVRWNEPSLINILSVQPNEIRPDGMILCYPVITGGVYTHSISMENLTGEVDPAAWVCQSLEDHVDTETPPAFLWHTYTDTTVPVENSILFFSALRNHGVNAELHIYPKGKHGLSLGKMHTAGPDNLDAVQPTVENWLPMAVRWLDTL